MFELLKKLVGDSEEALELVNKIEASATDNVATINKLERQVTDISDTRDKFKAGNSLVKSVLGIDAVNEDSVNEAIAKFKGNKGNEASLAEIKNLKDLLDQATVDGQAQKNGYESKLSSMALDNEIANSGVGVNVINEAMFGIVTGLIKNGASYEEGKIIYKNSDGSTVYGNDNQPLSLKGRIESLKTDDSYAGLFKPSGRSGSGTPPHNGGAAGTDTTGLSGTEMMKAGRPANK